MTKRATDYLLRTWFSAKRVRDGKVLDESVAVMLDRTNKELATFAFTVQVLSEQQVKERMAARMALLRKLEGEADAAKARVGRRETRRARRNDPATENWADIDCMIDHAQLNAPPRIQMPPGHGMAQVARVVLFGQSKATKRLFEEIVADYRHEAVEAIASGKSASEVRWLRVEH